jgi:hypothetical protein
VPKSVKQAVNFFSKSCQKVFKKYIFATPGNYTKTRCDGAIVEKRCNGAILEKVQWYNSKQELNSLVTSCDKARRGGKIY